MKTKKRDPVLCVVCGEEIVNCAGAQKYHRRCRDALYRNRGKDLPFPQLYELAKSEVEEQKKKEPFSGSGCDPKCPGLTYVGGSKAYCLLPVCRGKGFWTRG